MSYITSETSSNRFSAPDVGYVLTFEDEEYYTKTEIDSNHYTQSEIDTNHYTKTETNANFLQTDGSNAMNSDLDAGNNKIVNCNDPQNNKDVVNLQYFNANNTTSGSVKILEVTDVQSSTLSQNGAISHSKQVTGLDNNHYLCRIQVVVWGNFSSNYTYLQLHLQDDGFTSQYDPAKQAQQNDDGNVSRFQVMNGGEIGRENQETSVYTFTLMSNTTQQLTFNVDVIDNGGLNSNTTVYTKLHAFITPASLLMNF